MSCAEIKLDSNNIDVSPESQTMGVLEELKSYSISGYEDAPDDIEKSPEISY